MFKEDSLDCWLIQSLGSLVVLGYNFVHHVDSPKAIPEFNFCQSLLGL